MSTRKDIRAAVITAIEALVASTVTVDSWSGEEAAFNEANAWPAVYVAYVGLVAGDDEEVGSSTTYVTGYDIMVFVAAKTTTSSAGDEQAMDILETIEQGMSGTEIASTGYAELHPSFAGGRCEARLEVRLCQYLYGQAWRIPGVDSH